VADTSPSYYGNFSDKDQPTYNTVADYIQDARILLQDRVPDYRYEDPSLLTALNVTLIKARQIRPDFFVYNLEVNGQVQHFDKIDDTYVDIEPQFRPAIVHGICGHALERDQEDVQDIRASTFLQQFHGQLTGGRAGPIAGGSGPNPQQGGGPS
jgi:hypothetical protein